MKLVFKISLIALSLIILFIGVQKSFAQTPTYTLTTTVSGTTVTATATSTGSSSNLAGLKIIIKTEPFLGAAICKGVVAPLDCTNQPEKVISGNKITWTIKNLIGGTNYYFRAEEAPEEISPAVSNVVELKTGADTIDAKWPLGSVSDGTTIYIDGKINNPNINDFTVVLQYTTTPPNDKLKSIDKALPVAAKEVQAQENNTNNAVKRIGVDGTYGFKLIDLTPNTPYSFRQIITTKAGAEEIKVGSFTSNRGITPENSASQTKTDQERSYTLLAPLPGLSVVLDNDLCREYLAQGKPVPGGSCDNQISYFINLLITLLIGISVVVLVVKIIFEGYQYMVTDIPFIKASAKSKLFESFFGLLLAMASYLILNTINPRLVSTELNVAGIDISTEREEELDGEGQSTIGGSVIKITKSKIKYDKAYTNLLACAGQGGSQSSPNVATCTKYSTNITSSAYGKYIEKGFSEKINSLNTALQSKNITWRITEAWPATPGRDHKATCHKIGLCIDMNHTSGSGSNQNPTVAQVKAVVETAASLGMCAQYEILNNSTLNNQLVAAGLGKNVIFFNGKWISANHYSLYNGSCK